MPKFWRNRREGPPIGKLDVLIAACARAVTRFVTNNQKIFQIRGLVLRRRVASFLVRAVCAL
jgi:predicted nucleic acid-binding protein